MGWLFIILVPVPLCRFKVLQCDIKTKLIDLAVTPHTSKQTKLRRCSAPRRASGSVGGPSEILFQCFRPNVGLRQCASRVSMWREGVYLFWSAFHEVTKPLLLWILGRKLLDLHYRDTFQSQTIDNSYRTNITTTRSCVDLSPHLLLIYQSLTHCVAVSPQVLWISEIHNNLWSCKSTQFFRVYKIVRS